MDFKDIQYPSSPTYDHLLEILQDKFQNATVKSPVKKEPSFPSPDMINNQTISPPVEATELQQEQAVHIQVCPCCEILSGAHCLNEILYTGL